MTLETKDFTQDMGMVKEIAQYYFTTFDTKQVNQLAIRLDSIRKANYLGDIRQLMKGEEFCIALKNLICI